MSDIQFAKAQINEQNEILALYTSAIEKMESQGIH